MNEPTAMQTHLKYLQNKYAPETQCDKRSATSVH